MAELRFDRALAEVWLLIRGLNQYIEEEKPWELSKSDTTQLGEVLRQCHLRFDSNCHHAYAVLAWAPPAKLPPPLPEAWLAPEVGILFPKSDTVEKAEIAKPK